MCLWLNDPSLSLCCSRCCGPSCCVVSRPTSRSRCPRSTSTSCAATCRDVSASSTKTSCRRPSECATSRHQWRYRGLTKRRGRGALSEIMLKLLRKKGVRATTVSYGNRYLARLLNNQEIRVVNLVIFRSQYFVDAKFFSESAVFTESAILECLLYL